MLAAYDEDTGGILEYLGEMAPVPYSKMMVGAPIKECVDLLNSKKKKAGTITFSTKYVWAEPDPPLVKRENDLNKKCKL